MCSRIRFLFLLVAVVKILPSSASSGCPEQICPKKDLCIRLRHICDGRNDCGDNSDESYCGSTRPLSCPVEKFQCSSGSCIPRSGFCDDTNNCGDRSDEFFCNLAVHIPCPSNWMKCKDQVRCIPKNWKCDTIKDCKDGSDESGCGDLAFPPSIRDKLLTVTSARNKNIKWLLSRRKSDTSTDRWGHELPRIATALYLADTRFFAPGNKTGDEIGYELTIQLLHKLSGNYTMRSQELALYLQALVITCTDPSDFFGHNLVSELRRRVEASNYTNPFEILALCNAGDNMTNKDIERVTSAYDSPQRPFWTDTQAIATMAMQCLSTSQNVRADERVVKDMQDELKKRQFRNGTVDNPITTALVVQALLSNGSYNDYFNVVGAITALIQNQKSDGSWGSIRNSYYTLPVLSFKSLINISSRHCVKQQETEEEALQKLQDFRGEKFIVQYSVWIGSDIVLGRTWRVRMKTSVNNSFYDVIEMVRKLDSKHNVTYNVIDNKPYVSALYGKEDDPELGVYWFTYVRSLLSAEAPKLLQASPVDVKVSRMQELILWYKPGSWSGETSGHEEPADNTSRLSENITSSLSK